MTPEQVTALFAGAAVLLTAVGALIAQLAAIGKRTKTIQANTNGALKAADDVRKALEEQVGSLEGKLLAAIEEKLKAAEVARQAATDVREERERVDR